MAIVFLRIVPNVRVYEPLHCQSGYLSRYTKVSKRANLRNRPKGAHVAERSKPSASNGLYTLLALVALNIC